MYMNLFVLFLILALYSVKQRVSVSLFFPIQENPLSENISAVKRKNPNFQHLLKLNKDYITLQNCILIHDHTRNLLPDSFKDYFLPCNDLYNTDTRACAGSIFVPHVSSKTYGRKSIKRTSILEWNHLTQVLNQNLLKLTRYNLKKH